MSDGTNRNTAIQQTSAELAAKAKKYHENGMHELAKHWEKSAERLRKQGR